MEVIWSKEPDMSTMIHEKIRTTTVRTAVATAESVFLIPHFARIDVTPGKKRRAYSIEKPHIPFLLLLPLVSGTVFLYLQPTATKYCSLSLYFTSYPI